MALFELVRKIMFIVADRWNMKNPSGAPEFTPGVSGWMVRTAKIA
jgi:hypothetical protein